MSFPRSRIPTRLLRALLSTKHTADYQGWLGKLHYKNISFFRGKDTRVLANTAEFSVTESLLIRTWASLESKRMASSVHESSSEKSNGRGHISINTVKVIFVLGGPGSGKGTQCTLIVEHFGFTHLSAGDLLRSEINSGSENGVMIQSMIKEGKIVPSEVTVKLLQNAMIRSSNDKFLIDGFPRNDENRAAFELVTGIQPEFILFFDCTEKEMEKRLLGRNQGSFSGVFLLGKAVRTLLGGQGTASPPPGDGDPPIPNHT